MQFRQCSSGNAVLAITPCWPAGCRIPLIHFSVRKDYLLSKAYRKKEVAKRLKQLRELAVKNQGNPVDRVEKTNMNAFCVLQPSCIDASLDEAVKQHGSMELCIRDGLGMTADEIRR